VRRFRVIAVMVLVAAMGASAAAAARPNVRTVELTIHHSRFSASNLEVKEGEEVRFVVRNDDPIAHELIIGPMPVQLRHESGKEQWHPPIPGEVSVALFSTAETSYVFDEPGTVWFGCHLPGHWDYGMQGRIAVS